MSDLDKEHNGAHRWWLMPMIVGLLVTAAVLLLCDFRPMVARFYSVF
jgi:hypothetical protein